MKTTVHDVTGKLFLTPRTRDWCLLKYPGHPHGCPNYGKRDDCPPQAPPVEKVFDFSRPMHFIVVEFDLAAQKRRMLEAHPDWSEHQAACCLYWQAGVRKELASAVDRFIDYRGEETISSFTPEAMGVHVIATLVRACSLDVETPVRTKVFKVALLGYPAWRWQSPDNSVQRIRHG